MKIKKGDKVIVEGLNKVTKHNKPNQQNTEGSITTKEAPIHVSNVAILDPKTKKAARVGYRFEEVNGKQVKYRVTVGKNASGAKLDK